MSAAADRLRAIDVGTVGFAVAAVVVVVGILSVFSTAVDVSGLVEDQTRTILGVAGIAVGAGLLRRWVRAEDRGYRPPEREELRPIEVPGDELDEQLAHVASLSSTEAVRYFRAQTRDDLRELAIEVLTRHRGCTTQTAREQLRSGAWTDDERAASFFRLGGDGGASDQVTGAIRRPVGGDHPHTARARAAVAELVRIAGAGA